MTLQMTFLGFIFVLVLLSAHAKRFSVSCFRDFYLRVPEHLYGFSNYFLLTLTETGRQL